MDERMVRSLPGYELGEVIGRGGWGIVVRARHLAIGRDVAIKRLPTSLAADRVTYERFVDEARAVGSLDHPHIVKIHDFIEADGECFIVMEYLSGGTLWERFSRDGMRTDQACAIGLGVCSALGAAHQQGILHRDVKPENVLLTGTGLPRLGDFGIAKSAMTIERRTLAGDVVGTPTYMSPEQALGERVEPASDVYSMGMVLYELLSGQMPYPEAATPMQQLVQHVNEVPFPLAEVAPSVPGPVADVVMQALDKEPGRRPRDGEDLGVLLAGAACGSFGPGWLHESGIPFMAGGSIQDAATRGTPVVSSPAAPTLTMPVLRADHFRPAVADDAIADPMADPMDVPMVDPDGAPTPRVQRAAARPAAESAAGVEVATTVVTEVAAPTVHPTPVPLAGPDRVPGEERRRGRVLAVVGTVAVLLLAIGVAVKLGRGTGVDVGAATTSVPGDSSGSTASTTATAAPTVSSTTDSSPTGTASAPRQVTYDDPDRHCLRDDPTALCAAIDMALMGDDNILTVTWTPVNFEPGTLDGGGYRVHLYWDVVTAAQTSTDHNRLGVGGAPFMFAFSSPFTERGRPGTPLLSYDNRPDGANKVCAVVADGEGNVIDADQYDCVMVIAA